MNTTETLTFGDGLRTLANVVDALEPLHGEKVFFYVGYPGLYVTAQGDTPEEKKANAAEAARVVRNVTGATIDKKYASGDVRLRLVIVKHEVEVEIHVSGVCTRKVVGTETVELEKVVSKVVETVTEERDIVQWDCGGGLNLNGAETA